jgi:hypothetical protein
MNIRQERFAELVASRVPAMRAYSEAGYSNRGKNAEANAARLIEFDGVKERIQAIRAETAAKLALKREDLARHLWAVVMTPIGELDANSPLVQEFATDKEGRKRVKMQDKLGSARLLCEMMGWKEPEQMVIETGPKTLDAVRERAKTMASAMSLARVACEAG